MSTISCPGFIDIQVNGYAGIDYCDPDTSVDRIIESTEILTACGTAGLLATVITNERAALEQCVANIVNAKKRQGADSPILGIHVEGPFISPEDGYRGAHPVTAIGDPDLEQFRRLCEIGEGEVRLVTLAPELKGAADFVRAVAPDVLVAAGHTNADFATLRASVDAGLSLFTHIGNGCRQMIDRHDNIIMNAFGIENLRLCFIADGFHLPEAFLRALFLCRPPEGLIAVSDSVAFAGLPPGTYELIGREVVVTESGRVHLASDVNVMAGSSANLAACANNLARMDIATPETIRQVAFENPLRLLGLDPATYRKGQGGVTYNPETREFEITS